VRPRISVAAVVILTCACASVGCVGDDTVAEGNPAGVQGGSGPPPSSYEDATLPGNAGDAAEDAGGEADATLEGDAGDAAASVDAASTDAGDASDGA
jgi:hypothetical protein